MNAFRRGQRVEMTDEGRKYLGPPTTGEVVAFNRRAELLTVRRDGARSPVDYDASMWMPVVSGHCRECSAVTPSEDLDACLGCSRSPFCPECIVRHRCA